MVCLFCLCVFSVSWHRFLCGLFNKRLDIQLDTEMSPNKQQAFILQNLTSHLFHWKGLNTNIFQYIYTHQGWMYLHFCQLFWRLIIKMMLWIYSLWAAVALTYLHHKKRCCHDTRPLKFKSLLQKHTSKPLNPVCHVVIVFFIPTHLVSGPV